MGLVRGGGEEVPWCALLMFVAFLFEGVATLESVVPGICGGFLLVSLLPLGSRSGME